MAVSQQELEALLLRDIVQECILSDESNFLRKLRDDQAHSVFPDLPAEGPESVEAIDAYHMWITPIIAQFAATGLPHYSAFKAQTLWNFAVRSFCRRLRLCTWRRPMGCGKKKQP